MASRAAAVQAAVRGAPERRASAEHSYGPAAMTADLLLLSVSEGEKDNKNLGRSAHD